MPNLLFGADHKTRCFFIGKWAQALEVAPGTLQLDVLANNVLDIKPGFYLTHRIHILLGYRV